VIFSNGANWSEVRCVSARILKDLVVGGDHAESLAAEKALELVAKLRALKGRTVGTRGMFHFTMLGALWKVLTRESLEPDRLSKLWDLMDKLFGE